VFKSSSSGCRVWGYVLGSVQGWTDKCVRVQKKAAKFANLTNNSNWETLAQRTKIAARICAIYKAYSGEPAWKAIGDRPERSYYRSSVHHDWKIRNRRQRTDIGKYSFVNRVIQLWNKLPVNALGTFYSKPSTFREMVWKVISEGNKKGGGNRVFPGKASEMW
jgi:hypothetical protein